MLIAGAWCETKLTADMAKGTRFPVFCYGSNGIEQMRDRCRNDALTARRARLPDASRVFGGWSERWDGAVASVQPLADHEVRGSVVDLDLSEIILLDHFEAPNPDRPYSAAAPGAVYHRQDVVVLVEGEGGAAEVAVAALMYVKVDCTWRGPPSQRYLDSCVRNVAQFWDGGEIAVRDEHGNLRQGPGGEGSSGGGASGAGAGAGGSTAAVAVPPAAIASASAGQGEGVGGKGKGKAVMTSADDNDGVTHFDATASKTVQTLVEAFGFSMEKAVSAVDAIADKGDVNLAVQWLIDEGEEDHGGAVEFVCYTHLTLTRTTDPSPNPNPNPEPNPEPNTSLTLNPTLNLNLTRCLALPRRLQRAPSLPGAARGLRGAALARRQRPRALWALFVDRCLGPL